MFRHWVNSANVRSSRRSRAAAIAREYAPFLHITVGVALVAWGLEALFPFSTWRIVAGLYVLAWAGFDYVLSVFRLGVYVSAEEGE